MSEPGDNKDELMSFSYECWEETIKGVANVLSDLRGTWYSTDTKNRLFYEEERQTLEKYVTPWKYGIGTAVVVFLNFRIAGNPRFQAWRTQWVAQWRQHDRPVALRETNNKITGNNGSSASTKGSLHQANSYRYMKPPVGYLEAKRENEVKAALASMRFITDVLVSVSVGTSGALYLLHAQQDTLRRDFEHAPLVIGRSVVADQMCEPFRRLFDSTREIGHNDPNLITFSKFATNCRRRYGLENQIRKQHNLSENSSVSIPYPGLERYRSLY